MRVLYYFFVRIRRPPRSTQSRSSAASDEYKKQILDLTVRLGDEFVGPDPSSMVMTNRHNDDFVGLVLVGHLLNFGYYLIGSTDGEWLGRSPGLDCERVGKGRVSGCFELGLSRSRRQVEVTSSRPRCQENKKRSYWYVE